MINIDPACGSGNFLTETYISLRRLENKIIFEINQGQIAIGMALNPIKVRIEQFYGIEINDFAVSVAQTALWIAESQMMTETEEIVHMALDFLPLKSYANIIEGNALRIDWETLIDKQNLSYCMGNPPFIGARMMTPDQKADISLIFPKWKNAGNLDYVSCWYKKAADYIKGTSIRCAFVSTNSINQGESVASLWKPLMEQCGVHIDFAHRTFIWDSEAKVQAHVHCVIVGFSNAMNAGSKQIFIDSRPTHAQNINAYLMDAPDIFVESRKKKLIQGIPDILFGSMPNDGGYLSDYSDDEKSEIVSRYPLAEKYFRPLMGSTEFINKKKRWCIWLDGVAPNEYRKITPIWEAVQKVQQMRSSSNREATRKLADVPMLFGEIRQPNTQYLLIPRVSSQNRRYIPIGFIDPYVIASDACSIVPNASMYHFGVLTSNVHMAWMRIVAGRLKSDYRYSGSIVYNNFPWPSVTDRQIREIEYSAQGIIEARLKYPNSSYDDLYDAVAMPPDLRKAHQANDRAVMQAYGFGKDQNTESACVAALMRMYAELTKQ